MNVTLSAPLSLVFLTMKALVQETVSQPGAVIEIRPTPRLQATGAEHYGTERQETLEEHAEAVMVEELETALG